MKRWATGKQRLRSRQGVSKHSSARARPSRHRCILPRYGIFIAAAQKNAQVRTRCSANGIADSKLEHEEEALEGPFAAGHGVSRRERVSPAGSAHVGGQLPGGGLSTGDAALQDSPGRREPVLLMVVNCRHAFEALRQQRAQSSDQCGTCAISALRRSASRCQWSRFSRNCSTQ